MFQDAVISVICMKLIEFLLVLAMVDSGNSFALHCED